MTKSVPITPQIQAMLNAAAGSDVDPNTVAVFEMIATNTKPLFKPGSLFENATISRSTLVEMAAFLNGGGHVPLHTLHMQGVELPVGRLLEAKVIDLEDGSSELNALFYISKKTQAGLVDDIDAGVIDEVSVGLRTTKMLCSECGFDYKGPDASVMNLFDRECNEGHKIGKDGVHLNLVGLQRWFETSLVSIGAAKNTKILSRSKQALAASEVEQMAASGRPLEAEIVVASIKNEGVAEMDLSTLVAQIGEKSAALALAEKAGAEAKLALDAANTKIAELTAKVDELTKAQPQDLTKQLDEAKVQLAATQGEIKLSTEFLVEQATKAQVAAGVTEPKVSASAAEAIETIKSSSANLVNLLTPGGVSVEAAGTADKADKPKFGAFKVKGE